MGGLGKIGVIGAAGWLGGAIVNSLLRAQITTSENLTLSYRSQLPDRFPNAFWTTDNQELADRCDVIVLSVRPGDWKSVEIDANGKLLISVMAGVSLAALSKKHNTSRAVRALPNAAADVAKSYSPWVATSGTNEVDRETVRAIFDACGTQDEVSREHDIDYLTGLSGSGPAFPALLGAAMLKDAVGRGLDPHIAKSAVNAVLIGTGRLMEQTDQSPQLLVDSFIQYRGTTAKGIEAMQAAGFEHAVSRGLEAALQKAMAMGTDI